MQVIKSKTNTLTTLVKFCILRIEYCYRSGKLMSDILWQGRMGKITSKTAQNKVYDVIKSFTSKH